MFRKLVFRNFYFFLKLSLWAYHQFQMVVECAIDSLHFNTNSWFLVGCLVTQYDVYGNLFGLLASHPVAPLVTLHHLDVVEPIFPNMTRVQALQHLLVPMKLDSAALMQQSICYDQTRSWTVSVSWGFAVQIFRGMLSPREIEMPSRTFLNWYRRADYTAYAFNTRPVMRNPCQKSFVFYLSKARTDGSGNQTVSEYVRHRVPSPACKWKMADPAQVDRIEVRKKSDPGLWNRVSALILSPSHIWNIRLLTCFFCIVCVRAVC